MQTTCNDLPQLNSHKHAPAIENKTSEFSYCLRIKRPKMNLYIHALFLNQLSQWIGQNPRMLQHQPARCIC